MFHSFPMFSHSFPIIFPSSPYLWLSNGPALGKKAGSTVPEAPLHGCGGLLPGDEPLVHAAEVSPSPRRRSCGTRGEPGRTVRFGVMKNHGFYPLVNIEETMERSTIFNGKIHYKWLIYG